MKLAILLLCHEDVVDLAARLASPFFANDDVKIYVHYDARRSAHEVDALKAAVPPGVRHAFVEDRVACGWGDFTLVEATHRLIRLALADPSFAPDYLALISGSCVPIRPWSSLREFLQRRNGLDFIQSVDIRQRKWVKGGLEHERFKYYFPLNFKRNRAWFDRLTNLQRWLRVRRQVPDGLNIRFGSQWFCLTRDTAAAVSARLAEPALRKFFAQSWIPDEFAIQSLVVQAQRPERIAGHTLTYYEFDDQGRPLVLENGHYEHLLDQPFFFARKVSPHAALLRQQIDNHLREPELDLSYFSRAGSPTSHYQRFLVQALSLPATRARVGASREKWSGVMHVNQRRYCVIHGASRRFALELMRRVRSTSNRHPALDFVFDPLRLVPAAESATWLGLQGGMRPRRDHDPGGFLYELVNIDDERSTAFCIDAATESWVRDFVLWDSNATVLCCEPLGLGKYQRAEAALRDMCVHEEGALYEATLRAVPQPAWLPQDFYDQAARERKHGCQIVRLGEVPVDAPDPTLRVLRAAWSTMSAGDYFAESEDQARRRIHDLGPTQDMR